MRCIGIVAVMLLVVASAYAKEEKNAALSKRRSQGGVVSLFDGKTLNGWQGDVKGYAVENGTIVCKGINLYTAKRYANFIFRFEFKLPPGGKQRRRHPHALERRRRLRRHGDPDPRRRRSGL